MSVCIGAGDLSNIQAIVQTYTGLEGPNLSFIKIASSKNAIFTRKAATQIPSFYNSLDWQVFCYSTTITDFPI